MSSYIAAAFKAVCTEAVERNERYVVLMCRNARYGGPEEGGWYRHNRVVEHYQKFPSQELAEAAAEKIRTLAEEMTNAARTEHGNYCLQSMEWLEDRNLEADFLAEPDGPDVYYVEIMETIPTDFIDNSVWC